MSNLLLSQTNHVVDTSKVYMYYSKPVYKAYLDSQPKDYWIVSKHNYDYFGRNTLIHFANFHIKRVLKLKDI